MKPSELSSRNPTRTNPGSNDGMKVDADGNIWACAQGGIVILSPEGRQLGAYRGRHKYKRTRAQD